MAMEIGGAHRPDYRIRGGEASDVEDELERAGLVRVADGRGETGDLLLVLTGPAQLHVVVLTERGYVHADAGLRRVTEVPGPVPWRSVSAWRHPAVAAAPNTLVPETD